MSACAVASVSAASVPSSTPSLQWIHRLPKVEMHAHLSGSVRDATIRQLLQEEAAAAGHAAPEDSSLSAFVSGDRSLSECFEVFSLLHRLLSSLDVISRVCREVISDFAADEVVYLELRTTPRALPARGTSKRDYVQRVTHTIRECQQQIRTTQGNQIFVRLLLSIDRAGSQEDAADTVDLALEFSRHADPIVVGLDFSGNPLKSSFVAFQSHFERARAGGLKSSVHIGEKANDVADLDAVLSSFRPERIGHVVCLEARHTALLLAQPIPIEICPTSNLKTKIVQQLEQHPFGTWRARNNNAQSAAAAPLVAAADAAAPYPLIVCTDDSGVFNITLSSELHRLAEAFGMDRHELLQLETRAVEHGFADEACKAQLRQIFANFASHDALPADQRPVAILTCADEKGCNPSDAALIAAFASEGLAAEQAVWSDASVQWTKYRAVVVRTIWDYHLTSSNTLSLLQLLQRLTDAGIPVFNSAETIRWNHSKVYLRELSALGVPTVETLWLDSFSNEHGGLFDRVRAQGWRDGVIKPTVSAGGTHTYRFNLDAQSDDGSAASACVPFASVMGACLASGVQQWLVQPFCREVMDEGEFAFVFLNGEFSHCLLSTPAAAADEVRAPPVVDPAQPRPSDEELSARAAAAMQAPNAWMVQQIHGGSFRFIQPSENFKQQARNALHATPYGQQSLYARIDCIRRGETLLITEVELIEPELFGRGVPGFQRKFVLAIEQRIAQFRRQQQQQQSQQS